MTNGIGKESDLTLIDSLSGSDTVRVIKDGASRQETLTNFLASLNAIGGLGSGNVITLTGNYIATNSSSYILCDTASVAITVTLPLASSAEGFVLTVKNIDGANNVTVQAQGAETIDGSATDTLANLSAAGYLSDGSNWFVVNA